MIERIVWAWDVMASRVEIFWYDHAIHILFFGMAVLFIGILICTGNDCLLSAAAVIREGIEICFGS